MVPRLRIALLFYQAMRQLFLGFSLLFFFRIAVKAQETDTVRTFTFSSTTRNEVFQFPNDPPDSWSKVKMLYRMRCKNAQVSTSSNRNLGCGEWDYSCNTYLTDSSRLDSVKANHPNYRIAGYSGNSFSYSQQPTYLFTEMLQKQTSVSPGGNENLVLLGSTSNVNSTLLNGAANRKKMQILWKASELLSQNWAAGDLDGLAFDLVQPGVPLSDFRIRIRHISDSTLGSIADTSGFKEVYFASGPFIGSGLQKLFFYQPFYWNGTQNLVIELSWNRNDLQEGPIVKSGASAYPSAVSNLQNDHYLELDGIAGGLSCGDIDALDSAQIFTFEAWVNIRNWQNWTGIFKDNGKVVLETGDSPGALYCIIRNPLNTYGFATNVLPLNTWTHVAMVFDGTRPSNAQRLRLYINGVQRTLTFSGTIPSRTEQNNTPLKIGPGVTARIDEARVWSAALTPATVAEWMRKKVNTTHPQFASLQAAYSMDEGQGDTLSDSSPFQRTGILEGDRTWRTFNGQQIFKNLDPIAEKPAINLIRTDAAVQVSNLAVLDSIPQMPFRVESFALENGQPVSQWVQYLYNAAPQPVYNQAGTQIRTKPTNALGTYSILDMPYFARSPQKVELMSFVTPYGIGLDFGQAGRVWEFDMSDFVHQLRGKKRISIERGGEFQEELDIRFVFYRGIPPRKVLSLNQVWPVTHSSNADILADKVFEPRQLQVHPNSASWKIRSVITGHGQEGEFISRNHRLLVNGNPVFQWPVWTYCGTNPVYPQGGTWVYDRAGWCPGAPSDIQSWKVQGLNPGATVGLDYSMVQAGGDSRYIVNHQFVQYGPATFQADAALLDLKVPSSRIEFSRRNPACMNPNLVLRNEGASPISQLSISYGLEGGTEQTFSWSGNLPFLESETITLPESDLGSVSGIFRVRITSVNGLPTDENGSNDTLRALYTAPQALPERLVVEFKSNLRPEENSWELRASDGTVVFSGANFSPNTIYRDTLNLAPGCYEFQFLDEGQDGLNWWANTSQGTGYLRLKNGFTGATLRTFNPDFGGEVYQQFRINAPTAVKVNQFGAGKIHIWPVPASSRVTVWWDSEDAAPALLRVWDVRGKEVFAGKVFSDSELNIESWPSGMYGLEIRTADKVFRGKLLK